MKLPPQLLQTYPEARLLIGAKGWGLAKAAEYLADLPGLKRFKVSQASLSRKTTPGDDYPIEPEVATAVEQLKTQGGYDRQAAIVEAGLRAVHGDPPHVDVPRLAQDLREPLAQKLADTLTEKTGPGSLVDNMACSIADRLRASRLIQELGERVDRLSAKRLAITAAVAALVALVAGGALLAVPTRPDRTRASPASQLVVIVTNPVPGGSARRFDPGSLLAMSAMGEKPLDQTIPEFTLPGQAKAPCEQDLGEVEFYGNCWIPTNVKPPCGRLFRSGDKCYRPIAAEPQKPVEPAPNRAPAP